MLPVLVAEKPDPLNETTVAAIAAHFDAPGTLRSRTQHGEPQTSKCARFAGDLVAPRLDPERAP
jgi:hypothetical protein